MNNLFGSYITESTDKIHNGFEGECPHARAERHRIYSAIGSDVAVLIVMILIRVWRNSRQPLG